MSWNDSLLHSSPNRLLIGLWEHFALAASSVCRLYRDKIDGCADIQGFIETITSIEKFYRGSQASIESSLNCGRSVGSRFLRLHLRELAYEHCNTVTGSNGVEVYVLLRSLLSKRYKKARRLGKRTRHRIYCPHRNKRIALEHAGHHETNSDPGYMCQFSASRSDHFHLNHLSHFDNLSSEIFSALPNSLDSRLLSDLEVPNSTDDVNSPLFPEPTTCQPLRASRKRYNQAEFGIQEYFPTNDDQPIYNEVSDDAVHVANLLDPLSKFSVNAGLDSSSDLDSKRRRMSFLSQTISLDVSPNSKPE